MGVTSTLVVYRLVSIYISREFTPSDMPHQRNFTKSTHSYTICIYTVFVVINFGNHKYYTKQGKVVYVGDVFFSIASGTRYICPVLSHARLNHLYFQSQGTSTRRHVKRLTTTKCEPTAGHDPMSKEITAKTETSGFRG